MCSQKNSVSSHLISLRSGLRLFICSACAALGLTLQEIQSATSGIEMQFVINDSSTFIAKEINDVLMTDHT